MEWARGPKDHSAPRVREGNVTMHRVYVCKCLGVEFGNVREAMGNCTSLYTCVAIRF